MRKSLHKIYKTIFSNRFIVPLLEVKPKNIPRYISFWKDYITYERKPGMPGLSLKDIRPILEEKTKVAALDSHYFYQDIWAAGKIIESKAQEHVDVGSKVELVGFLTTVAKVKFVDIRILDISLPNFEMVKGSILDLPFQDNSVQSLSCLHVAEHIGLGRYGDPLNPEGTWQAAAELKRVLAPGGKLYFSLPVGKEKIVFNAHRIHNPYTILDYFKGLTLVEFSAIDDRGNFIRNTSIDDFTKSKYSCGLFELTK
jgi:SAM-dependent methyltransferase